MNISKNTNNSSNKTDNQKPNPELEFALAILKFYIQLYCLNIMGLRI